MRRYRTLQTGICHTGTGKPLRNCYAGEVMYAGQGFGELTE